MTVQSVYVWPIRHAYDGVSVYLRSSLHACECVLFFGHDGHYPTALLCDYTMVRKTELRSSKAKPVMKVPNMTGLTATSSPLSPNATLFQDACSLLVSGTTRTNKNKRFKT